MSFEASAGNNTETSPYDAVLLVSFGGPEGPDDVIPFLENVVRGKNVPRERLLQVAEHYHLFDGVSPLNSECRAILTALVGELNSHGLPLPIYWGNRHWHPMLTDAVQQMADDGVKRALAFVTSAFGSFAGCREYLEAMEQSRQAVGADAPKIDKLRLYYNHPGFIEPLAERVTEAMDSIPQERRKVAKLIFTAHSLPVAMAERSPYEKQLHEACRLVVERLASLSPRPLNTDAAYKNSPRPLSTDVASKNSPRPLAGEGQGVRADGEQKNVNCKLKIENADSSLYPPALYSDFALVFQSRSGPPTQPWLGPDIGDYLRQLAGKVQDVILVPIGFVCEHMEVVYDLDVVAAELCDELGIQMVRAGTVGSHPRFIRMIRELIAERTEANPVRLALGVQGPWPDQCPEACCR